MQVLILVGDLLKIPMVQVCERCGTPKVGTLAHLERQRKDAQQQAAASSGIPWALVIEMFVSIAKIWI